MKLSYPHFGAVCRLSSVGESLVGFYETRIGGFEDEEGRETVSDRKKSVPRGSQLAKAVMTKIN